MLTEARMGTSCAVVSNNCGIKDFVVSLEQFAELVADGVR